MKHHTRINLAETHKFGDLRKQFFFFENQYIGFDALMIEYYTNARFTLDQELEADLFALRVMRECGLSLFSHTGGVEGYRRVLKILEGESSAKEAIRYGSSSQV